MVFSFMPDVLPPIVVGFYSFFYFGILEVLWNFQALKTFVFNNVKVSVFFVFFTCGTT